jgi:hypothetical protein
MKNFKINWTSVMVEVISFILAFIIALTVSEHFNLSYVVELLMFLVILYAFKGIFSLIIKK